MTMLCAIAIIDSDARDRLQELERVPPRFGFPPRNVHGHITLATYVGADEAGFIASCKVRLDGYGKFPVHYEKIESWDSESGTKSVVIAAPRKENAIVTVQREIVRGWSADLNKWTRKEAWSPHTTLLYIANADLDMVAEAMQEEFEPFAAWVSRIEFSRVFENEGRSSFEIVDHIELQ